MNVPEIIFIVVKKFRYGKKKLFFEYYSKC